MQTKDQALFSAYNNLKPGERGFDQVRSDIFARLKEMGDKIALDQLDIQQNMLVHPDQQPYSISSTDPITLAELQSHYMIDFNYARGLREEQVEIYKKLDDAFSMIPFSFLYNLIFWSVCISVFKFLGGWISKNDLSKEE